MQTFAKPPAARRVEARSRARTKGVRVAVIVHDRKYVSHSLSQPGVLRSVERTPAGWACSCEGYFHTEMCHHLGAVERRSEREGWPFGTVAPLARVERYMPLDPPLKAAAQLVADRRRAPAALSDQDAPTARRFTDGPKPPALVAALADLYGDDAA